MREFFARSLLKFGDGGKQAQKRMLSRR